MMLIKVIYPLNDVNDEHCYQYDGPTVAVRLMSMSKQCPNVIRFQPILVAFRYLLINCFSYVVAAVIGYYKFFYAAQMNEDMRNVVYICQLAQSCVSLMICRCKLDRCISTIMANCSKKVAVIRVRSSWLVALRFASLKSARKRLASLQSFIICTTL